MQLNCKSVLITNCDIRWNEGQFASLEPSSSDPDNPLNFNIQNTDFFQNNAKFDGLIRLTTNSRLFVKIVTFKENFSIGRGSILFADYKRVEAEFEDCVIQNNYAY